MNDLLNFMDARATLDVIFWLHALGALWLLWSCIYRFTHTSKMNTRPGIRRGFSLLAVYAVAALVGPLAWHWQPDGMHLLAVWSIGLLQHVTAAYWQRGVPFHFRSDSERAKLLPMDAFEDWVDTDPARSA